MSARAGMMFQWCPELSKAGWQGDGKSPPWGWVNRGVRQNSSSPDSLSYDPAPKVVVLPELSFPQGGAANWGNGFLPADYQATTLRPAGSPILDLQPPPGIRPEHQRANLDLLAKLNARHRERHPDHDELAARMNNYELAFRMQMTVQGLRDLHVTILRLLGLDDNKLTYFHGGRFKQLSQFGGQVIRELMG
jgi:hypothetical protein